MHDPSDGQRFGRGGRFTGTQALGVLGAKPVQQPSVFRVAAHWRFLQLKVLACDAVATAHVRVDQGGALQVCLETRPAQCRFHSMGCLWSSLPLIPGSRQRTLEEAKEEALGAIHDMEIQNDALYREMEKIRFDAAQYAKSNAAELADKGSHQYVVLRGMLQPLKIHSRQWLARQHQIAQLRNISSVVDTNMNHTQMAERITTMNKRLKQAGITVEAMDKMAAEANESALDIEHLNTATDRAMVDVQTDSEDGVDMVAEFIRDAQQRRPLVVKAAQPSSLDTQKLLKRAVDDDDDEAALLVGN